ncbi:tetratricopeptide repeat protein [Micromonosporaceae bacterium Da 78-11]
MTGPPEPDLTGPDGSPEPGGSVDAAAAGVARARAELQRGNPAGAAAQLGPILAGEPDHVEALLWMAYAQLDLVLLGPAHDAATAAVRLAPENPDALDAFSRVLSALLRHDAAIHAAYQAVRLDPEFAFRHHVLARALIDAGGRTREAEQAALAAIRLNPHEALFRITYATVLKRMRRRGQARTALHDALAIEPDNAVARHELALLDVGMRNPFAFGRLARGATGLAGALRTDPGQQISREVLDLALRLFLNRTGLLLGLFSFVAWQTADRADPLWPRSLAGAGALVPVLFAAYFVRKLDRTLTEYLTGVVLADRYRIAVGVAGLCLLLMVTATVAPAAWLPALLKCATIGAVAVPMLTAVAWGSTELALAWTGAISGLAAGVLVITAADGEIWPYVVATVLAVFGLACLGWYKRREIQSRRMVGDDG